MAFIAYHPDYCLSLPEGHRFPMLKYELLPKQILREGIAEESDFFEPDLIAEENILFTHKKDYWFRLKELLLDKNEIRRMGFPLSKSLVIREMRICQGTIDGAVAALETGIGFNISGGTHHAGSNWAEGFCLLNDQAIAANYLMNKTTIQRILIIDLDVHQGNGTAEIFQDTPSVFTFSMHGAKNFPFRKEKSDLDIDLADYTQGSDYLKQLEEALVSIFERINPEFVFYQAGCDVLISDKLGRMSLSHEDCRRRDKIVFDACKQKSVPVQVSMGGGYSPEIKHIVDAHTNTFREGMKLKK